MLQVGKTIECSNCTNRSDYFADCRDMLIPCPCWCHCRERNHPEFDMCSNCGIKAEGELPPPDNPLEKV